MYHRAMGVSVCYIVAIILTKNELAENPLIFFLITPHCAFSETNKIRKSLSVIYCTVVAGSSRHLGGDVFIKNKKIGGNNKKY